MQLHLAYGLPRRLRLARMRSILVQRHPDFLVRIPAPDLPQKADHKGRTFAVPKRPAHPATVDLVDGKHIEPAACPLLPGQHQTWSRGVATSTIGFDIDRLDIKEQKHAVLG